MSALLLVLSACARSFAYYYERSQFDSSVVLVADVGQLEQSDFSVTEYWRCFAVIGTIPDAQKSVDRKTRLNKLFRFKAAQMKKCLEMLLSRNAFAK